MSNNDYTLNHRLLIVRLVKYISRLKFIFTLSTFGGLLTTVIPNRIEHQYIPLLVESLSYRSKLL